MIIVTGGAWQGKLAFARGLCAEENPRIAEGADASWEEIKNARIAAHFHLYIRKLLEEGNDPFPIIRKLPEENPDIIIEVTELGCGIVPVDAFDRTWREITGRICCELAAKAGAVYRVCCGIGTKIK